MYSKIRENKALRSLGNSGRNPCFNGRCTPRVATDMGGEFCRSRNPCFNGRCTPRDRKGQAWEGVKTS